MNNRFRQGPFEIVEIKVTSASQTLNFPDVPQLRNDTNQQIIVKAVELITDNVLQFSVSDNSLVCAPVSELSLATLVLYDRNWNKVYQMPLLFLNHMQSEWGNFIPFSEKIREFNDLDKVDWNKSQIVFVGIPTPSYSIMLGVDYERIILDPITRMPAPGNTQP